MTSWSVAFGRMLLYGLAFVLYLLPLSSPSGMIAAALTAMVAIVVAERALAHRVRPLAVLCLFPAAFFFILLLSQQFLDAHWPAALLGLKHTFVAGDILTFGLLAFCTTFALRVLSTRFHVVSLVEVAFVTGSVAMMMADHRNRMLNRPRFFADWAWSQGIDPTTLLVAIGVVTAVAASFLFLRRASLYKLIVTALVLLLFGSAFFMLSERRIAEEAAADPLGLSGKNQDSGGGQGDSDDPFKNDYSQPKPPKPVAIAILRDDFSAGDGVIYFRQKTLSDYNGHHLVASSAWDKDVLDPLPSAGVAEAPATQSELHHLVVPTTMYLLVDHAQPPALTHAVKIGLVENPNPQQFVSAYDVTSRVLSVPPGRLLGRRSVPADWPKQQRQHYTAIPDDPRYSTLSSIVLHKLDPRFASDDMAKALTIKRYLEQKGFYTLRSTHKDANDPTASFLFGSLRGYCVHFAHAAVYLMRSQGIAARVALGYAVQTTKHGGGSAILIMGDRAHAWPEIYLEGIGWITLDVYPERTDMPPPPPVDYDLEKLLGEMARRDKTGAIRPEPSPFVIPWQPIGQWTLLLLAAVLLMAYIIKVIRRVRPSVTRGARAKRALYVAWLDRLSDLGWPRRFGETREEHAQRVRQLSANFVLLTQAHLAQAFASAEAPAVERMQELAQSVRDDLRRHVHPLRRIMAWFNPVGWFWTR